MCPVVKQTNNAVICRKPITDTVCIHEFSVKKYEHLLLRLLLATSTTEALKHDTCLMG